jgi:AraC-like DNA-binding protein
MITELVKKHKPTFIAEKMERSQIIHANELATEMSKNQFPLINIKTKGLILLTSFLNNLVSANTSNHKQADQALFYPEIKQVENRLNDYFDKQMLSISELAAKSNMSTSKLQRGFKMVYGKSIYAYYLEKKLALGKSLIISREKTISEIAYSLGYNKINSFSKAFKKHYGVLPKDVSYRQAS